LNMNRRQKSCGPLIAAGGRVISRAAFKAA